jgi:hypothetical protein
VEKEGNLILSICQGNDAMEKRKLNSHKDRNCRRAKSRLIRSHQKVRSPAILDWHTVWRTDDAAPGLKRAPTASELSTHRNLVIRTCSQQKGRDFARRTNGIGGKGDSKKQMPACNG